MIRVETWPDYLAAGQSRLLASEWHALFGPGDNRSQLTWRNRLDMVPSDRVCNFCAGSRMDSSARSICTALYQSRIAAVTNDIQS